MALPQKLKEFLEANDVSYEVFTYKQPHYRSLDLQQATPVPDSCVVKSVVLKADERFILAVLQARLWIDLERLKRQMSVQRLRLADEAEFAALFPDCEFGAVLPLGNLYGLEVWIDQPITQHNKILFKAGTHVETILMLYSDFQRIVGPVITNFSGGKPWL